jgi:hypothetical protein
MLRDTQARLCAESDAEQSESKKQLLNVRIRKLMRKAEHIEAHTAEGIFAKLRIFADVRGESLLESIMQDVARIEGRPLDQRP